MKKLYIYLLCIIPFITIAQDHTIGIITYDPDKSYDGYTLFFPHRQGTVHLLNNCGELVHQWEDNINFPGNSAQLLPNGDIYIAKKDPNHTNTINAGGSGQFIEKRDWDNNLLWKYEISDTTFRMHHDFTIMPNGNVLLIVWERIVENDLIMAGRDPNLISVEGELWMETLLEIEPVGSNGANIVWQWRTADHLVQDYDITKPNFGNVANNPQLINLNYDSSDSAPDWQHANAIDYNSELDQIVISIPEFNEIWIIDHSTTIVEAESHSGGNSGRGGDLLYRWGNPITYDYLAADQKIFYSHNIHWIDKPGHPHDGKLMCYNNRIGADYSAAVIFAPVWNTTTLNYEMDNNVFLPTDYDWIYTATPMQDFYSRILSSVQLLPNNNYLICSGIKGRIFEITPQEEIVWEYKNPFEFGVAMSQGDTIIPGQGLLFKVKRYAPDFSGFDGRDLTAIGHIELNPDINFCDSVLAINDISLTTEINLYPNPTSNYLNISIQGQIENIYLERIELYDILGRKLYNEKLNNLTDFEIDVSSLANGVYFVSINEQKTMRFIKQ